MTKSSNQGNRKTFHLTKIKKQVLTLLAEFFCLRTNDLVELVYGKQTEANQASMRRTLNLLRNESLVNRLPYLEPDKERGGITFVSGLSDKGVKAVEFDYLASLAAKTFDEHSQRTLDHELEIAFFHIALKAFCKRKNLALYWQQRDLKCTVNPDAYFAITDPSKPEGKNTLHYFLEIERAKFGHYRNGEPQIMKKLGSYYDYFNTDKCEREWANFRQFRVIIVQPSEHRRGFLLSKLAEKYKHRMFWLTTESAYKANLSGNIFSTPKDFPGTSYSLAM